MGARGLLLAHHLAEALDDRVLRRVVRRVLRRDLEHGRHHALVLVQEVADLGRTLLRDEDDRNLGVGHKAPERLLDLGRRRFCVHVRQRVGVPDANPGVGRKDSKLVSTTKKLGFLRDATWPKPERSIPTHVSSSPMTAMRHSPRLNWGRVFSDTLMDHDAL